jgi:hypothetical protein
MGNAQYWVIHHFSHSNQKGAGQGDVPALLRRVAEAVEELGLIKVQDVTFDTEVTEDGPWHSMTVYFHKTGEEEEANDG